MSPEHDSDDIDSSAGYDSNSRYKSPPTLHTTVASTGSGASDCDATGRRGIASSGMDPVGGYLHKASLVARDEVWDSDDINHPDYDSNDIDYPDGERDRDQCGRRCRRLRGTVVLSPLSQSNLRRNHMSKFCRQYSLAKPKHFDVKTFPNKQMEPDVGSEGALHIRDMGLNGEFWTNEDDGYDADIDIGGEQM